ncbi:MAG TPA: LysR family transcriptional regulator, partial [Gemmatimonadaceae bacterium]|nr:LysR family transcriptional regulator [Gemmatimonadaceae bacterium]
MDTTLLLAFAQTADAGSLSRAARDLELSQPSLTAQIQRLEKHLGAALFDRHARGVTLTDAGRALYPRARRILEEVRTTEDAIRREAVEGAATLSVGAIPTVAPYVLPAALQRLRARHAAMRVELREDYSAVLAR